MPNCEEVARLVASEELADSPWLNRALVRFHLFRCRDCADYAAQLRAIGIAARDQWDSGVADTASLEKLEGSILERCREALAEHGDDGCGRDPGSASSQSDPH